MFSGSVVFADNTKTVSQRYKYLTSNTSTSTNQPSFDCKNANKLSEKKICINERLSVLDVEMSINYKKFSILITKDSIARRLKNAQIYWLKIRNNCGDNLECLEKRINTRNNDLKFMVNEVDTSKGIVVGLRDSSLKCDEPFNKLLDENKITGRGMARITYKVGDCKMFLIEKIINIFYPHNSIEIEGHGFTTYRELPFLKHLRGFISSGQAVEYFLECEFEDTCGSMHMMLAESWGTHQIEMILEKILGLLDGM